MDPIDSAFGDILDFHSFFFWVYRGLFLAYACFLDDARELRDAREVGRADGGIVLMCLMTDRFSIVTNLMRDWRAGLFCSRSVRFEPGRRIVIDCCCCCWF
jgi:hypothetical protein